MIAIMKKELRTYFNSIIGWLFIAFFLAFVGLYVFLYNFLNQSAFIGYALSSVSLIFALLVPMVTMRIIAEENKQKTDQLLLTSPVSIWKIVLGKFMALEILFALAMVFICFYPLIFKVFGPVNMKMSYVAILGFFLVGSAYLAIGLFISSLTESQAFSAVMTFVVVLITCLADGIAAILPSTARAAYVTYTILWLLVAVWLWRMLKNSAFAFAIFAVGECVLTSLFILKPTMLEGTIPTVFGTVSVMTPYNETITGVFNLEMPVYYISIAFVFCFLTYQNIRKRRYN